MKGTDWKSVFTGKNMRHLRFPCAVDLLANGGRQA